APPEGDSAWDYAEDLRLVSDTGILRLVTLNGQGVRSLLIGPPLFRYGVRVLRAGGARARALPQFSDETGAETYLVQTWPLEDVFDSAEYLRPQGIPSETADGGTEAGSGGYRPSHAADWPSMRPTNTDTNASAGVVRASRISYRTSTDTNRSTGTDQPRPVTPGFRDLSTVSPEEFSRITGLPMPTRPAPRPGTTRGSAGPRRKSYVPGVIYEIQPGPKEELFQAHPELARHPERLPSDFFTWPENRRRDLLTRWQDDIAIMDGLSERTEPRRTLQPADFPTKADQASPGIALRTWLWLHPRELDAALSGALRTELAFGARDALSGKVFTSAIVTILMASAAGITVRAAYPVEAARLLAAERVHSPRT
ncbi:hypothetical protein, partial [Glutamicibacter sp. V16R2B1]|uniref:hypothetical protein n=1 Tax=Glutamicibacter sp. V16R2B1 TaxID=2036207 RepID=UPI001BB1AD3A